MKKNVGSQLVSAQMTTISDGSDTIAGTCNVAVEIDGVAGTGGTATHIADGKWEYAPIAGDTDGDYITFQFKITGSITHTVQVYTTFPQTVDNKTGITSLANGAGDWNVGKSGYALTTADWNTVVPPTAVQNATQIWEELTATARTAGTYGQLIKDDIDAAISSAATATGFATTAKQDTMETTLNDVPSTAEFEARTVVAAAYFDPAADDVTLAAAQAAVTFVSMDVTGTFTVLDGIVVSCSTTNKDALKVSGNGSGEGFKGIGGATGHGMRLEGGATSGSALSLISGPNSTGLYCQGDNNNGMNIIGDNAGHGIRAVGGSSAGSGIQADGGLGGPGFAALGNGAAAGLEIIAGVTGHGISVAGGGTSGDGMNVSAAGSGGDIVGDITGNLSGSIGSNLELGPTEVLAEVVKLFTTQMAEDYAADGTAPTLEQSLMLIQQALTEFAISSTTLTIKKVDGSATAATLTLSDATNPVSATRAT